jgi:hypothetical protein
MLDGGRSASDASEPDAGRPVVDGGGVVDAGRLSAVGERCDSDSECETGFCYDVSLSNPFCFGSVRTIGCTDGVDRAEYAAALGGSAPMSSCVGHSVGTALVCDFSWGHLPGAEIACE